MPNIQIEQLYIKWNEKLNLSIENISLTPQKESQKDAIEIKQINELLKEIFVFNSWFESIRIGKIALNDISATFQYQDNANGFMTIASPDFSLKSTLFFTSNLLTIHIDEYKDTARKIMMDGTVIVDNKNFELITSFNININNDISLNILAYADENRLLYKLNSLKNIKDITHTMKLLNLPQEVKYWAYEAIKMSHLTITSAHGWLDFNNLQEAYKNVYVSATGHNLSYTYNPKLDAIHTKITELEYINGVLNIHPIQAYSYNFYLNKSWLNIDFTKKEELLTLYLLFDGKLNKDILNILSTYAINLPFLQNSGITKTDLTLKVGLRNIEVDAHGDFFTKQANFDYLGLKIDIFDAYISLNNYDVKIENMLAHYRDIAKAKVNVIYNAQNEAGKIDFDVKDITFKDVNLSLDTKQPLNVTYSIAPNQDTIDIADSSWHYQDKLVKVEKLSIPFSLEKLILEIPKTVVRVPNIGTASISGVSELKTDKLNLDIDILNLIYKDFKLSQPSTPINLTYDKKNFKLTSNENIQFMLNTLACGVEKPLINIKTNELSFASTSVVVNEIAHAKMIGNYNITEKKGFVSLQDLKIESNTTGEIFSSDEKVYMNISESKESLKVAIDKFDINYLQNDEKWSVAINSLEKLSNNSKLLQEYNLTSGTLNLNQNLSDMNMKFIANIKYPYKLLVKKNEPIEEYTINGKFNNKTKKTSLNINESIKIYIDKDIKVRIKESGINMNALLDFLNRPKSDTNSSENNTSDMNSSNGKNVILTAKDSYLYISDERHILADTIQLQFQNKTVAAKLIHEKGEAIFKISNDELHVYGENFNDQFMGNFFASSKFKGGSFDFSIDGTLKEYDGLFYIKDTVILDYKILNNILAFVNTVPSLVTFSLPGYSSKGLSVKSAYMNFHAKENDFTVSDIFLDSQEIDILGRGTASLKTNTTDLLLNLKTNLGSSISQIPLVGHLILDGNTLSTTLSVTGSLDDPSITYLMAKDIVVAPLNIIKRVLLLPFNLINSDEDNESKEDE